MRSSACARGVQVAKKAAFRGMVFSSSVAPQRPGRRLRLQRYMVDAEALVQPRLQLDPHVLPLAEAAHDDMRGERGAAARDHPDVEVMHGEHAVDARHLAADGLDRKAA